MSADTDSSGGLGVFFFLVAGSPTHPPFTHPPRALTQHSAPHSALSPPCSSKPAKHTTTFLLPHPDHPCYLQAEEALKDEEGEAEAWRTDPNFLSALSPLLGATISDHLFGCSSVEEEEAQDCAQQQAVACASTEAAHTLSLQHMSSPRASCSLDLLDLCCWRDDMPAEAAEGCSSSAHPANMTTGATAAMAAATAGCSAPASQPVEMPSLPTHRSRAVSEPSGGGGYLFGRDSSAGAGVMAPPHLLRSKSSIRRVCHHFNLVSIAIS